MATEQDLFVSVTPQMYKRNKSLVLTSQADLLQSLRRLHNLKVLASQKNDLRKQFHNLTSTAITQINFLQHKIPAPEVPKTIHRHKHKKSIMEPKFSKEKPATFSKRSGVEDELKLIQAKLRELNS